MLGTTILVIDADHARRGVACAALIAAGWQVRDTGSGDAALALLRQATFRLVLLDLALPGPDGRALAEAIRATGTGGAYVPILACSRQPEGAVAGVDGQVDLPHRPDLLVATVCALLADPGAAARARMERSFGTARWLRLIAGLRALLASTIASADRGEPLAEQAHRVAGLAGTLGFGAVSEAWLPLADGDRSGQPAAIDAARRAIDLIDRRVRDA